DAVGDILECDRLVVMGGQHGPRALGGPGRRRWSGLVAEGREDPPREAHGGLLELEEGRRLGARRRAEELRGEVEAGIRPDLPPREWTALDLRAEQLLEEAVARHEEQRALARSEWMAHAIGLAAVRQRDRRRAHGVCGFAVVADVHAGERDHDLV